jgi:hypothetical protein
LYQAFQEETMLKNQIVPWALIAAGLMTMFAFTAACGGDDDDDAYQKPRIV